MRDEWKGRGCCLVVVLFHGCCGVGGGSGTAGAGAPCAIVDIEILAGILGLCTQRRELLIAIDGAIFVIVVVVFVIVVVCAVRLFCVVVTGSAICIGISICIAVCIGTRLVALGLLACCIGISSMFVGRLDDLLDFVVAGLVRVEVADVVDVAARVEATQFLALGELAVGEQDGVPLAR